MNKNIGFEEFEEDFIADLNTMYIKPENVDSEKVTQIIKPSSEQRSNLYDRLREIEKSNKVER